MARGHYVPTLRSPLDLPLAAPAQTAYANLPPQVTAFIGRETELAEIATLLADPACRLLTLVGPGGIGKTRLALAAAERVAQAKYAVTFVSLAQVDSSALIVTAIADAFDIKFYAQADPREQLLDYLQHKTLLLVLDNFEQLLPPTDKDEAGQNPGGAALVLDIIRRAPGVTCLVTSRERLNLYGEWVFEVEGLSLPQTDTAAAVESYSAVSLFLQSARRARVQFRLQSKNRQDVMRICRLVGGMPLGLELAAAWVATLSCAEIAREIKRNLDFLATSMLGVPERHRTIRAVFDTSWPKLTDPERVLFKRLSVFRGNFSREAAEVICGDWPLAAVDASMSEPQSDPTAPASILRVLSSLVDKSFLRRVASERYEVHELLRHYGQEKLAQAAPDEALTRRRYGDYYLTFLANQEARLKGTEQREAVEEVAAEQENVYAAWQWAVAKEQVDLILQATEALWKYSDTRGRFHLNELLFSQATTTLRQSARDAGPRDLALSKLLIFQGGWAMRLGAQAEAIALLTECVALLRGLEEPRDLALALNMLAAAVHLQGDYEQEQQLLRESITLAQAVDDRWLTGYSLNDLGMATFLLDDPNQAEWFSQEALALFREIDDVRGQGFALHNLGVFAHHVGCYAEAKQYLQESLDLRQENDDPWGMASTLTQLGNLAQAQADFSTSRANLQTAIGTAWQIRAMPVLLEALVALAAVLIRTGEAEEANEVLSLSLQHPSLSRQTHEKAKWLLSKGPDNVTQTAKTAPQPQVTSDLESLVQRYMAE